MLSPHFESIFSPCLCLCLGFSSKLQGTVKSSPGEERTMFGCRLGTSKMVIPYIPQSPLPTQAKCFYFLAKASRSRKMLECKTQSESLAGLVAEPTAIPTV